MNDDAAIPVQTREELVSLLCEAAELEHGLACSYLYAAFSLKTTLDDGLQPDQLEAVDRWRHTIMEVAEQEMLHLALVSNLLTAVGAAPHLRRPPIPHRSPYYPAGITIELSGFDEATLTRFIFLERPEHVEIEDAILDHPSVDLDVDVPVAAPGALAVPDESADADVDTASLSFSTVGHLYQTIEAALVHLVEQRGERRVFIGPPVAQATSAYFELNDLVPVTDLASARQALEVLTTQGEGVQGDWSEAHYGMFLAVRRELRDLRRRDPDFEPAQPVIDNPTEAALAVDGGQGAAGRSALELMRLFNNAYTLMTLMLVRFFAHTDETEAALRTLARGSVDLMEDVISPLGELLARTPVRSGDARTSGASFEFYRSATLLPHRRAAWLVFHERLVELAHQAGRLADGATKGVLTEVGSALGDIALHLEEHLDGAPLVEVASAERSLAPVAGSITDR